MNYKALHVAGSPTSSNILILPSQFWQIRFKSCWLHCSKCRILVLLRYMYYPVCIIMPKVHARINIEHIMQCWFNRFVPQTFPVAKIRRGGGGGGGRLLGNNCHWTGLLTYSNFMHAFLTKVVLARGLPDIACSKGLSLLTLFATFADLHVRKVATFANLHSHTHAYCSFVLLNEATPIVSGSHCAHAFGFFVFPYNLRDW